MEINVYYVKTKDVSGPSCPSVAMITALKEEADDMVNTINEQCNWEAVFVETKTEDLFKYVTFNGCNIGPAEKEYLCSLVDKQEDKDRIREIIRNSY